MYRIHLRFYEELNDYLPRRHRKVEFQHNLDHRCSLQDLTDSMGVPRSQIDLILVNGESKEFSYQIGNNDRISVYPVFESLDISSSTRLRNEPLRVPRFVTGVSLARLGRYLQRLGFDVKRCEIGSKKRLEQLCLEENRIHLTCDDTPLERSRFPRVYRIRAATPLSQIPEILKRFDLHRAAVPLTHCLACKRMIQRHDSISEAKRDDAEGDEDERVKALFLCQACRTR